MLGDDTVAFRAFPQDESTKLMPYWRVFTLDLQTEKGWSRSNRPRNRATTVGRLEAEHRIFEIMSEGHDLKWIPVPGWPVPGIHPKNRVTSYAEVAAPNSTLRQAKVAVYDQTVGITEDARRWRGSPSFILKRDWHAGPEKSAANLMMIWILRSTLIAISKRILLTRRQRRIR